RAAIDQEIEPLTGDMKTRVVAAPRSERIAAADKTQLHGLLPCSPALLLAGLLGTRFRGRQPTGTTPADWRHSAAPASRRVRHKAPASPSTAPNCRNCATRTMWRERSEAKAASGYASRV